MKITLTKEIRENLTEKEIRIARAIIASESGDDTMTAKEAAEMIGNAVIENRFKMEVLSASAEIAKNSRVWGYYCAGGESSEHLDVWIRFRILAWDEFIEGGAYLSDVYQLGDDGAKENLLRHSYIRRYVAQK